MVNRLGASLFVSTRQGVRRPSLLETYMYKRELHIRDMAPLMRTGIIHIIARKWICETWHLYPLSQNHTALSTKPESKGTWSSPNAVSSHKFVLFHNP
jgi:hypothetical protein